MKLPRFSGLLAAVALLASALPTFAQTGSIVYWRNFTGPTTASIHHRYQIGGFGISEQFHVYPAETASPSAASYAGAGRAFLADEYDPAFTLPFNPIPGTNLPNRIPLIMSESPTNYAPVIAVFRGQSPGPANPLDGDFIDESDPLWSNDNADTFLSWQALRVNLVTQTPTVRVLYRYNGSKTALFGPAFDPNSLGFNPFQPQQANPGPTQRIVRVATFPTDHFTTCWDSAGNRVILQGPDPLGFITNIITAAGPVTTVLNDPNVTGMTYTSPVFSNTVNEIYTVAQATNGSVRGLAAINPTTNALRWILMETGDRGISQFKGPVVSPDGQSLAFTLLRPGKVGTLNGTIASLATIPVTGGSFTPLWNMGLVAESGPLRVNNFEPTGWKTGTLPPAPPPPPIIQLPDVGPRRF